MISPRNSPRCTRRSTTPTIASTAASPIPPPLPPRKASPTLEQVIIPTTSHQSAHSSRNGSFVSNGQATIKLPLGSGLNEAQSVQNLSQNVIEVPSISKSNSMHEMHVAASDRTESVIEVSAPETIYGFVISNFSVGPKTATRHLSCPSSKKQVDFYDKYTILFIIVV